MKRKLRTTVLIIGAGPMGLTVAAKLVLNNIDFLILERGSQIASNIREWGHVSLFSKWADNTNDDVEKLLKESKNYQPYTQQYSTGHQFVSEYLEPFSRIPHLDGKILLNQEVHKVKLINHHKPYQFESDTSGTIEGNIQSQFVIDASGTWGNHNPIFTKNKEAITLEDINRTIPYIDSLENNIYNDSKILVIGNGHSAMNTLLELSKCRGVSLHWAIRSKTTKMGKSKVGGSSDKLEMAINQKVNDQLIQLHSDFEISTIKKSKDRYEIISFKGAHIYNVSFIFANIGHYANHSITEGISLSIDNSYGIPIGLVDKVDPCTQSCSSVNYHLEDLIISTANYYVVGMKSFGKASNFLLKSGYKVLDELVLRIKSQIKAKKFG